MSSTEPPLRHKRWAPRVRTGCHTCRIRRVKCDEAQPICKKCLASGRECHYSLIWRPPTEPQPESWVQPTVLSTAPLQQPPTLDADIMQAIRYYATVVCPQAVKLLTGKTNQQILDPRLHIWKQRPQPSFIMLQMSHRISTLCHQNAVLTRQHAVPDAEALWRNLYAYVGQSIAVLNQHINNRYPMRFTLFRVIDFICVGLAIVELPWRSHMRGFLALVQHYGGPQTILESPDFPFVLQALHFVLLTATMANTTSPPTNQISQLYDWTDKQCLQIYTCLFCESLPCPSSLFIAIRRVTRLRVALAVGDSIDSLVPTATLIAHHLHDFAPENWVESYKLPPPDTATAYARAFKFATILYSLLSLPAALSRPFAQQKGLGSPNGARGVNDAHTYYRGLLRDTIILGEPGLVHSPPGRMCWPLAVLGAACSDGTAQDKAGIVDLLKDMCRVSPVDCGPDLLLDTLPRFWASGKTAWDDCFATPIHTWIWSVSSHTVQMRLHQNRELAVVSV